MKRKVSLYSMALLYMVAGSNHFIHPAFYIGIMPSYIPCHAQLVALSGILEIVFGILVLFKKTRAFAFWCIVLMLIAFLPVHIQMLIDNCYPGSLLFWIAALRLPLQYVLIRWAYKLRHVVLQQRL